MSKSIRQKAGSILLGLLFVTTLITHISDVDELIEKPREGHGALMSILIDIANYLLWFFQSAYFVGFMAAVFLWSIVNWSIISHWISKARQKKRDLAADLELANECEQISKLLYGEAARIQRIRTEIFFDSTKQGAKSGDGWAETGKQTTREEERVHREYGPGLQTIIVKLRTRGVKLNLWGLSLSASDLNATSYFLREWPNHYAMELTWKTSSR